MVRDETKVDNLLEVAVDMTAALIDVVGPGWSVGKVGDTSFTVKHECEKCLASKAATCIRELRFQGDAWQNKGKWCIDAYGLREVQDFSRAYLSINAAKSKTPRQLAQDVRNRLVPEFPALYSKAYTSFESYRIKTLKRELMKKQLIRASKGRLRVSENCVDKLYDRAGASKECRVEATVYDDVKLEFTWLTIGQARALVETFVNLKEVKNG